MREWLSIQLDVKANKISDRYTKGIADFLCCVGGVFVAIELKAEDKKPSKHQLLFIKEVQNTGGIAGVCETLGEVKSLINAAREKFKKC